MKPSKNKNVDAGFITKASTQYSEKFPLRAAIQAIPVLGSPLDTMLSGLGAKYQYKRLEHFILELQQRLTKLEENKDLTNIEPGEPLFDFIMQTFDQVIKTRSEEKRKRFANLVANQIVRKSTWSEAETACRLLGDITDIHIKLLDVSLKVPVCDGVFEGLRVVMFTNYKTSDPKHIPDKPPTNITPHFPELSADVLRMICSELVAKGLFYDESIGRWGGPQAMTYLRATNMAQWLMNWICEPAAKSSIE